METDPSISYILLILLIVQTEHRLLAKETIDANYAKFWTTYAEDYLKELSKNHFDQESTTLKAWVKAKQMHDKNFAFDPKMSKNDSRETYGRCALYSTCTGKNELGVGKKAITLGKDEACIPNDRRKVQEECNRKDSNSTLFELIMIGWGPNQYAPVHDHPDGGCLIKAAKGPGYKETLYSFLPKTTGLYKQFFCCQERNITISGEDDCRLLECENSYGCDAKEFSVQNLLQIETFLSARGNENEVRTLKGHDVMHEIWNPFNETSYQLSHYLGDFSRITFWYPDDYEHDIKCKSRGDDQRLELSGSITLKKGCNTCSP